MKGTSLQGIDLYKRGIICSSEMAMQTFLRLNKDNINEVIKACEPEHIAILRRFCLTVLVDNSDKCGKFPELFDGANVFARHKGFLFSRIQFHEWLYDIEERSKWVINESINYQWRH